MSYSIRSGSLVYADSDSARLEASFTPSPCTKKRKCMFGGESLLRLWGSQNVSNHAEINRFSATIQGFRYSRYLEQINVPR
jgi:hypothetical protein